MESLVLMMSQYIDKEFWCGKKVFVTGHTGFKGGWLVFWLKMLGAEVVGYALPPNTTPSIFDILKINKTIKESHFGDVRNFDELFHAMDSFQPDIVFHMAAQPLVRYSYKNPIETFEVNVMGTVNVLEALRKINSVKSTVIITTDKCYENIEKQNGYVESDPMGGCDPYSSSKGCAELVVNSYRHSFFGALNNSLNSIASARAGNVIGGGDWSQDRLIPDAIRAFSNQDVLMIRNPNAVRPWQHVLEPLSGYLMLAQALYGKGEKFSSGWNFGPLDSDAQTVEHVLNLLAAGWGKSARWRHDEEPQPYESLLLKLNCLKAETMLGWKPKWSLNEALSKTTDWYKSHLHGADMISETQLQIEQYML